MIMQILVHTPTWVYALFAALVALGLWQRRSRALRPGALWALPLTMLALGLWSLAPAFMALPATLPAWALALALGIQAGRWLPVPTGTAWLPAQQRLQLPGSWLPLAVILLIFGLRYASNVALALQPAWRSLATVQLPLALAFGAVGGLLLGRALRLLAVARGDGPTIVRHERHASSA